MRMERKRGIIGIGQRSLYFSRYRGTSIGRAIMEQSLPALVSATQKPFGNYLAMLIGTIWADDAPSA